MHCWDNEIFFSKLLKNIVKLFGMFSLIIVIYILRSNSDNENLICYHWKIVNYKNILEKKLLRKFVSFYETIKKNLTNPFFIFLPWTGFH